MARIVLGVSGGIAAYKAVILLRLLVERGHEVTVVPTRAAENFIGEATWAALSGRPVATQVWQDVHEVPHVRLGQQADVVIIAPATADLLARAVVGRADDLLTATLLTARCPIIFAPAMHTEMWEHPATVANIAVLRERGGLVVGPGVGRLTGQDSGPGRLAEPQQLAELAELALSGPIPQDLLGQRVVISAGGTREPIDPVRFIGNRSSGKQGYAVAVAAMARGAEVCLVHTGTPVPAGVRSIEVETAAQLRTVMLAESLAAQVVVMAAAVADFRLPEVSGHKIKKVVDSDSMELRLIQNPDILRELVAARPPGQLIVGFAAETGDSTADVRAYGEAKLAAKGCDLLVINDVSDAKVFGADHNQALIVGKVSREVPLTTKLGLSQILWECVAQARASEAVDG